MLTLTDKTYRLYAIQAYTNEYCLTEREFDLDLSKVSTIRKLISTYLCGHNMNLRVIVNTVIGFYNVFEHHSASKLLQYKNTNEQVIVVINTILRYLYLPECHDEIDQEFMDLMITEFGERR